MYVYVAACLGELSPNPRLKSLYHCQLSLQADDMLRMAAPICIS